MKYTLTFWTCLEKARKPQVTTTCWWSFCQNIENTCKILIQKTMQTGIYSLSKNATHNYYVSSTTYDFRRETITTFIFNKKAYINGLSFWETTKASFLIHFLDFLCPPSLLELLSKNCEILHFCYFMTL